MKELMNGISRFFYQRSVGLLLVRIATGYIFLEHGMAKVTNIAMPIGMMMSFGFPGWVGVFIAWLEVLGGAALIAGVLTRPFAVAFAIQMVVAFFLTGGFSNLGRHDLEIVLALNSAALALVGSGRFSLWRMECRHCGGMLCNGEAGCPKEAREWR